MAFFRAVRSPGEPNPAYANRLRYLSRICNYSRTQDERLRVHFVAGEKYESFEIEWQKLWQKGTDIKGKVVEINEKLDLAQTTSKAHTKYTLS